MNLKTNQEVTNIDNLEACLDPNEPVNRISTGQMVQAYLTLYEILFQIQWNLSNPRHTKEPGKCVGLYMMSDYSLGFTFSSHKYETNLTRADIF